MLWSKLFIPTLREVPAGVEGLGAGLLTRAGFLRNSSGSDCFLHLGHRTLQRLASLFRSSLEPLGGQEMSLSPATADLSFLARSGEIRSYRQLPQIWYRQSGTNLALCLIGPSRKEAESILASFLTQTGAKFTQADSAFVALSDEGATPIACCDEANYAVPLQSACTIPKPPAAPDLAGNLAPERFHTPNQKSIADLVQFTGEPASSQMKSLVMVAGEGKPVLVLVRGDHQLEPAKLRRVLGSDKTPTPATAADIAKWFGASPGSLGPVGAAVEKMPILCDLALEGRRNMTCGANEDDYHLRYVTPGEDFKTSFHDLRQAEAGDLCPALPTAVITIRAAHTLARIVTHQDPGPVTVTNESGAPHSPSLITAEIDLRRIMLTIAEQSNDRDGIVWPRAIAPFDVILTPANFADETQRAMALQLYQDCQRAGLTVLLDDRDERPGVKFKDADLTGIPARVTIGKKAAQGLVELVDRKTKQMRDLDPGSVPAALVGS